MARDVELILDDGRTVTADENTDYIEVEGGMLCVARMWLGALSGGTSLDVRVQSSPDGGTNYYMSGKFQQIVPTDDNKVFGCLCYIPRPASGQFKTRVRLNYDADGAISNVISKVVLEPLESISPPALDEKLSEGIAILAAAV